MRGGIFFEALLVHALPSVINFLISCNDFLHMLLPDHLQPRPFHIWYFFTLYGKAIPLFMQKVNKIEPATCQRLR